MTRKHCPHCHFPKRVCLCASIEAQTSNIAVHVLQHPSEVDAAKSTVKLLKLVLPEIQVHVGETEQDFQEIIKEVQQQPKEWAVIYPSDTSVAVDRLDAKKLPTRLIAIDGTWRKALRIIKQNEWLAELSHVTLPAGYQNQYHIRKTDISHSVSTLEAVALCLHHVDGQSMNPYLAILQARVQTFQRFTQES